jgi:hypothetical protein
LLNELSKNTSYKNIKKLIINDISIEPIILIKNINKKYRDLKRKTNPSYFNTVLRAYTKDAIRCSNEVEIKIIYKNYLDDLKKQFNDMDMDLNFCLEGLKAINKEMKTENNKNQ